MEPDHGENNGVNPRGVSPVRLHVFLAREANTAVIVRRGPAKVTCTIGWNREDDTFHTGQWMRARLYWQCSDLSPDGKWLIYFAFSGNEGTPTKKNPKPRARAWTAISRAPFLKAVGFWPSDDFWPSLEPWNGGMFIGKGGFQRWNASDAAGDERIRRPEELREEAAAEAANRDASGIDTRYPWGNTHRTEPVAYYLRLERDGWERTGKEKRGDRWDRVHITVFQKALSGGWTLEKPVCLAPRYSKRPGGSLFEEHRLFHPEGGIEEEHPEWEWADVDRQRVVWVESGRLHAAEVTAGGPGEVQLLKDFNDMKFERLEAPY